MIFFIFLGFYPIIYKHFGDFADLNANVGGYRIRTPGISYPKIRILNKHTINRKNTNFRLRNPRGSYSVTADIRVQISEIPKGDHNDDNNMKNHEIMRIDRN